MATDTDFGLAMGIMSGTSCDGADAVMLQLGDPGAPHVPQVIGTGQVDFPPALAAELRQPANLSPQRLCELHFLLPEYYARAAAQLPPGARVCGVHGQTIWHQTGPRAAHRGTLQLGSGPALAQALGLPVVHDLRGADVALGGLGAPISPLAHWFFVRSEGSDAAVVNFGGMCNFTFVAPTLAEVVAYDVGPGMVLSDAFAVAHSGGKLRCDHDGVLSRGGKVVPALLQALLDHPFVRATPPKSTGREDFSQALAAELVTAHAAGRPAADVAFSFLAGTAAILAQALRNDPRLGPRVRRLVLTGGGAYNPTLVDAVAQACQLPCEVPRQGVLAPQVQEPAAMALLAARTMVRLPSSLPQVTGASRAAILGSVCMPS